MPKIVFSSDQLPADLSNEARAAAWLGRFEEAFGKVEIDPIADVRFRGHIEAIPLGDAALATLGGSFAGMRRTRKAIIDDGQSNPVLIVNLSPEPFRLIQRRRESIVDPGGAVLFDPSSVGEFNVLGPSVKSLSLDLPRAAFSAAVQNADDMVGRTIEPGREPLRMLRAYADMLVKSGGTNDPTVMRTTTAHLIDLVALMLGTTRDVAQAARQGGLRAGRLNAVLAAIDTGYADPAFSLQAVARKERVSERYLRDLLHESGSGFTDRVQELRLNDAWRLLASARHAHRKVIDIALSCGFNNESYFHRSFRSRFGMTPSDARAAAAVADLAGPAAAPARSAAAHAGADRA
jgi:AraC-like DNA-binding protein